MLRANLIYPLGLAAILISSGAMASTGPDQSATSTRHARQVPVSFDLASLCATDPDCQLTRHAPPPQNFRSQDDATARQAEAESRQWTGPMLRYQPYLSGPSLEAAALGAGSDAAPALAHLALNWNF